MPIWSAIRTLHQRNYHVLIIGSPDRFACGKQIGSYLGLIPCEDSSANRQRLGHITKYELPSHTFRATPPPQIQPPTPNVQTVPPIGES
jgi:hypothetical protein